MRKKGLCILLALSLLAIPTSIASASTDEEYSENIYTQEQEGESEVISDVSIAAKSLFKELISLVCVSISIIIPASLTLYSSSFSISNLTVLIDLTISFAAFSSAISICL